jgi:hypothetical protein
MTTTFSLSKPFKTHDGELTTLTLRAPTARSFIKHNEPFKIRWIADASGDRTPEVEYSNSSMVHFLADMIVEKVDDLMLGNLSAFDYMRLRGVATDIILGVAGTDNPTVPSV